jgi:uncharacterized membrane protein YjjB (DUF3815 family)
MKKAPVVVVAVVVLAAVSFWIFLHAHWSGFDVAGCFSTGGWYSKGWCIK